MKITNIAGRELTENELFAIDRFSYYYDNNRAFVVIGDNAVVVMDGQSSHEKMIEFSKASMNSLLNSHPDFSSYVMDDRNALIEMLYNVFSVIDGKQAGLSSTDEQVPINIALQARSYCLDAAQKCEIVAIVEPIA